jgi:flagellar biosynthesis repressor protein FlbT
MTEFMNAISSSDVLQQCVSVSRDVMAGEHYKALIRCRKLIEYEDERLK